MKRLALSVGAVVIAALGIGAAFGLAQVGQTVATETFTNVVTYTIPTVHETTTVTDTVTETVTVTTPPTTPTTTTTTTTPPPPPPSGGTTINVNSGTWQCSQPLSQYGPLPITVNTNIPNVPQDNLNGDVRLNAGCTGDGNTATTDLILHVNGNGNTLGATGDGIVLVGAHDIEIEGWVNCGRVGGGSHQDGIQMNSGHRLTFRGFDSGNWSAQTATCHGAGGVWYVSALNQASANLTDVRCENCRMVGTNPNGGGVAGRAFYLGASTRSGARNSCFAARIPFTLEQSGAVIAGINVNNLLIDTDSSSSQPSPGDCQA